MYTLFDTIDKNDELKSSPLADRMRPRTLKEFLGQSDIAGDGSLLRRAIMLDRLGSCIFFGPPGTGKTTLANVIANSTSGYFVKLNAVTSGVADVKKAVDEASFNLKTTGKRTYLLLDECHRFNKAQQDSLLPSIESGTIIFIGSTTENPYVAMTPAIVSRCKVFEFKKLSEEIIKSALITALKDEKRGLGSINAQVDDDALNLIAFTANGDLRTAYNGLELAVLTTPVNEDGIHKITVKDAEQSMQKRAISVDENLYYHILSAFCKSLRGSDSDAALYYSQRLIKAGCDPMLIARRLVVHSAEDVGNADPNALVVATSAMTALQNIGLPEGLIPLSEAIIYVCEAPKSNSTVVAIGNAERAVDSIKKETIPPHLINPVYLSKEDKAKSAEYKYPHNYGGYVEQQYLPDELVGQTFYTPSDNGYEKTIKEIRKQKGMKK